MAFIEDSETQTDSGAKFKVVPFSIDKSKPEGMLRS